METVEIVAPTPTSPAERPVQWLTGIKAALGIAVIFLLVTRGIPWAGSGLVSPTAMGRELKHPGVIDLNLSVLAIVVHFALAMVYASIMMPLIHRFVYSNAWLVGAGMGVILYLCNLAAFALMGDGAPYSRELPVLIAHVAFGIVFTGVYKGLAKRRIMAEA